MEFRVAAVSAKIRAIDSNPDSRERRSVSSRGWVSPGYTFHMGREHFYEVAMVWTGNRGTGTSDYRAYSREHEISVAGKSAPVLGSSDAAFRGDPSRYSPEELLVASLSSCHMLWFLP